MGKVRKLRQGVAVVLQHSTAKLRGQSEKCIRFFSVAVIKDPDKRQLEGKEFNPVYNSRRVILGPRALGCGDIGRWGMGRTADRCPEHIVSILVNLRTGCGALLQ